MKCRDTWKYNNRNVSLLAYYLELLRASEGTLSCWSRLHLQSLAPTNPQWARVGGYGPISLCVIHKVWAPAVGTLIC
jgi:hypothetical protein